MSGALVGGDGAELVRAPRFRPRPAWYVADHEPGLVQTTAWSTAERLWRTWLTLLEHLEGPVDVAVLDVRRGQRWFAALRALDEVRAALADVRRPVLHFGGVEVVLCGAHDQLALTPDLLLMIDARSERWRFLLDALGFEERSGLPPMDWDPARAPQRPAPALAWAVDGLVARLALAPEP
jgi:hypothetical protein